MAGLAKTFQHLPIFERTDVGDVPERSSEPLFNWREAYNCFLRGYLSSTVVVLFWFVIDRPEPIIVVYGLGNFVLQLVIYFLNSKAVDFRHFRFLDLMVFVCVSFAGALAVHRAIRQRATG